MLHWGKQDALAWTYLKMWSDFRKKSTTSNEKRQTWGKSKAFHGSGCLRRWELDVRKVFIISLAAAAASAQTSSKKCSDDCLTCPTTCPWKYKTQKHGVKDTNKNPKLCWNVPDVEWPGTNFKQEGRDLHNWSFPRRSIWYWHKRETRESLSWLNKSTVIDSLEKTGPLFFFWQLSHQLYTAALITPFPLLPPLNLLQIHGYEFSFEKYRQFCQMITIRTFSLKPFLAQFAILVMFSLVCYCYCFPTDTWLCYWRCASFSKCPVVSHPRQ